MDCGLVRIRGSSGEYIVRRRLTESVRFIYFLIFWIFSDDSAAAAGVLRYRERTLRGSIERIGQSHEYIIVIAVASLELIDRLLTI